MARWAARIPRYDNDNSKIGDGDSHSKNAANHDDDNDSGSTTETKSSMLDVEKYAMASAVRCVILRGYPATFPEFFEMIDKELIHF